LKVPEFNSRFSFRPGKSSKKQPHSWKIMEKPGIYCEWFWDFVDDKTCCKLQYQQFSWVLHFSFCLSN